MLKTGNAWKPATTYDVAKNVGQTFPLAFTQRNITHSFQVSSLHPLNVDIFKDYEFLPSTITDQLMPLSDDQPENQSKHIEDFLSRPGHLTDSELKN